MKENEFPYFQSIEKLFTIQIKSIIYIYLYWYKNCKILVFKLLIG